MRRIIVVTCIVAASILASCDRRESAWRDARRQDTPASYRAFLERHPTGKHAAEARAWLEAHRESEEWTRAERLGTPEAWQRYLAGWPEGRHAEEARRLLVAFIPPPRPAPLPAPSLPAQVASPVVYEIQLGAWSYETLARAGFERAIAEHAGLPAGVELRLVGPGEAGDALWRLRAGPFDEEAARAHCARLALKDVSCAPVPGGSAVQPP